MNVSAKLTVDGLVRALRFRMHQAADEIEAGYLYQQQKNVARNVIHDNRNGDLNDGLISE